MASSTAGSRAASLLGGLIADTLQSVLMRRLPIDVLNIDPGDLASTLLFGVGCLCHQI